MHKMMKTMVQLASTASTHIMKYQHRQETFAYVALWTLMFAVPLADQYMHLLTGTDADSTFSWEPVLFVWRQLAALLVVFLVHNHLLAPLLVYRQRRLAYLGGLAVTLGLFVLFQCHSRPMARADFHRQPRQEQPAFDQRPEPPEMGEGEGTEWRDSHRHEWRDGQRHQRRAGHHHRPPLMFGQHDVVATIILLLVLGANLGIKYYFKTRRDRLKLAQLEKQNLEQQLEYLKYQINPHFFMNTLNNIHALVDIDSEKAKDTIVELSKMMRFILYEGNKRGVPLAREMDFIRNYVRLMSLRYTDRVKIRVELPTELPDRTVPPLMLITFVENAFKHGISYQHESFVDIDVDIDSVSDRLHFSCRNSKAEKPNQEKGGVGLTNVKQRLKLLYDNNFTLTIHDEPDIYSVELTIPVEH